MSRVSRSQSLAAVQSGSVMILFPASAGKRDHGAGIVAPDFRSDRVSVFVRLQAAVSKKKHKQTASNAVGFLIPSFIVIAPVFDALIHSV